ncbi:MAG TPA: dihydroorotase, partial [Chitinophagales bacterium]
GINAEGKHLFAGVIDDQVHFREPGLTHKADIYSEARAGVAGGTTSFMEMPNTNPPALTDELLEAKYQIASQNSLANYSFFMGVSNDNTDIAIRVSEQKKNSVCGLKIFMGSSTGNMLVDNREALEKVFAGSQILIATHCEDEARIRERNAEYSAKYGDKLDASFHPIIRDELACYLSSSMAVELAKKHNTRLHILHISTADELPLFTNEIPLEKKRITSEVCVHHLWFDADDYAHLGNKIKCNPAIKDKHHKPELLKALLDNKLDIIATDHAPHTLEEKKQIYTKAPSGLPLVQHSLQMMLEFYYQGKISLEKINEKMSHAPAICFQIKERGFLREGYFADVVLVDLQKPYTVQQNNIYYKCGWSPLENYTFQSSIEKTFVSGHLAFDNGTFNESVKGKRLSFNR